MYYIQFTYEVIFDDELERDRSERIKHGHVYAEITEPMIAIKKIFDTYINILSLNVSIVETLED